jgi:hypothetical protein
MTNWQSQKQTGANHQTCRFNKQKSGAWSWNLCTKTSLPNCFFVSSPLFHCGENSLTTPKSFKITPP